MAIKPICDRCKKELTDYGALLLSPPGKNSTVTKFHICKKCYQVILMENKIKISKVLK